jgi:pimeloyl-ACP methyl ester carboxylesterase
MIRRSRAPLTVALAGMLALTACSSGGATFSKLVSPPLPATPSPGAPPASRAPATPSVSPVTFTDCTAVIKPQIASQRGGDRDLRFGCGRLRVPLDYTNPSGQGLRLFLLRVRLGGQRQRIGSLVVNPGGPGGSGLDAAVGLALQLPLDLLRRFDLVGFDPRGVGLSSPLTCIPDSLKDRGIALDPDARAPGQYAAQAALARQIAQGCSSEYGRALGHYNTEETARDMELVRQGVDDAKLTYLGYSYGSRLGSVYAHLFPRRVRALVLDGAVNPVAGEVAGAETQARGFENAYDRFAADCRRKGTSCLVGPDARASLTALVAQARRAPIRSSAAGETRSATAGHVLLAAISALYDQDEWRILDSALYEARNGDAAGVLALADRYSQRDENGKYTNLLDANVTINCTDTKERVPDAVVTAKLAEWRRQYPLFGTSLALGLLACQQWTGPRHPLPVVKATGAPPILVVGTVNDPATPYASAQVLARQLASGRLLTWQGDGHTAYPKTPCVTAAVGAYLIDLTPPPGGTSCPRTG